MVHGLFERSPEQWQAIGAPSSLWDEIDAARAWQDFARPECRMDYLDPRDCLDDPDLEPPTTTQVLAHDGARIEAAERFWRAVRWYVLSHADALTPEEVRWLETYRPTRWLADLDPHATERHLFG